MEAWIEQWFKWEHKGKNIKTLSHWKKRQDLVILGHKEQVIREEGRGKADWEVSILGQENAGTPKENDEGQRGNWLGKRWRVLPRPSGM